MDTENVVHARIPFWGVDLQRSVRPGVPKETPPRPIPHAHWVTPERQPQTVEVLRRADLSELTPVFSTAVPPHGVSGMLRRYAYRIPDDRASHWLVLMIADKVDVIESALADLVSRARRALVHPRELDEP